MINTKHQRAILKQWEEVPPQKGFIRVAYEIIRDTLMVFKAILKYFLTVILVLAAFALLILVIQNG